MSLTLIIGPMFSGKTLKTLTLVRKHRFGPNKTNKIAVIKHSKDNRSSKRIGSHYKGEIGVEATHITDKLSNIIKDVLIMDVIQIDDAHFFNKSNDLLEFTRELLKKGKIVYVNGLNSDWKTNPLTEILKLAGIADKIHLMSSVCEDCGKDAILTKKTTDSEEIFEVGGADMYKPVCRECHNY